MPGTPCAMAERLASVEAAASARRCGRSVSLPRPAARHERVRRRCLSRRPRAQRHHLSSVSGGVLRGAPAVRRRPTPCRGTDSPLATMAVEARSRSPSADPTPARPPAGIVCECRCRRRSGRHWDGATGRRSTPAGRRCRRWRCRRRGRVRHAKAAHEWRRAAVDRRSGGATRGHDAPTRSAPRRPRRRRRRVGTRVLEELLRAAEVSGALFADGGDEGDRRARAAAPSGGAPPPRPGGPTSPRALSVIPTPARRPSTSVTVSWWWRRRRYPDARRARRRPLRRSGAPQHVPRGVGAGLGQPERREPLGDQGRPLGLLAPVGPAPRDGALPREHVGVVADQPLRAPATFGSPRNLPYLAVHAVRPKRRPPVARKRWESRGQESLSA